MTADAWITLAVIVGVLVLLIIDKASPAIIVLGGTVGLLIVGVIDPEQAFSGFSNPAPITVAALFVLAAGVEKTGALAPLMQRTLGERGYLRRPLLRLTVPTVAASAFLNNTPIVAMLVPQVTAWADRRGVSVSKLLMPISFAALLGGVITLIGTSTNLVVSGQMHASGLEPIGFFEIALLGLPIALLGSVIMIALAPRVLPARRSAREEMEEEGRRFNVEMLVDHNGPVDGQSVEQAKLRNLRGLFLASVDRGDSVVAPVRPDTVLRGGDRLHFVGQADQVVDLQSRRGLSSAELTHVKELANPSVRYFETVIGSRSPIVGNTLREFDFRSRYQAAVVAIERDGHLVEDQLGRVPIRVGDTLMLVSDPGFRNRWYNRADFLLIAEFDGRPPQATRNAWIPIALLAAVVLLAALDLVPILQGALAASFVLVALRVLTPAEAARSIDVEVIVVIAAAFGIAAATESSGLAQFVADSVVHALGGWGERGVLLGIVLATMILTELITNNAAALLMVPIGVAAASATTLDPRGVAIAVAVAASMSFLTPIGYQTNTMVYGPGGYRFTDYVRLGAPLTLLAITVIVLLVPVLWAG